MNVDQACTAQGTATPESRRQEALFVSLCLSVAMLLLVPGVVMARPGRLSWEGAGAMSAEPVAPMVLVELFGDLLRDGDQDRFTASVRNWYSEGTLERVATMGQTQARIAAVLALGWTGSYRCNATLGLALHDADPTVRQLAADGLWFVWFRAGTPQQNAKLQQVSQMLREAGARSRAGLEEDSKSALEKGIQAATELIAEAPTFAEAYNQRAIAYFQAGRYEDSIRDCQKVLDLNPYHFGAASGMGNCYLRLDRPTQALDALRRAVDINPGLNDIRGHIELLEQSLE